MTTRQGLMVVLVGLAISLAATVRGGGGCPGHPGKRRDGDETRSTNVFARIQH